MSGATTASRRPVQRFKSWLLADVVEDVPGPEAKEGRSEQHAWWQVVCLTGVDYFSTLGYIPGIAALAAGALSPIATLFIVGLTLFGALPMYRRVAEESPHGQGSIAMLENLLSFWRGKLLVLVLLGFVATAWIVTITLSAADAAVHVAENPLVPSFFHGQEVTITLALLAFLGAVFLKGFKEAIGIAVFIVGVYLLLNLVVVGVGFYEIATHPRSIVSWQNALFENYGNPLMMVVASLLVFPRLALGLSGFETGVGMMPLVRGDEGDRPERPEGRIRNTRRMLTVAALTMSFYLITTSLVTVMLIPSQEFEPGSGQRARPRLRGARSAGGRLRHRLRPLNDNDIGVRGRLGYGRAPEHRAALLAALRHGARVGAGDTSPRPRLHRGLRGDHDHLLRRRGRPGWRLRYGGARDDDLRRLRGNALDLAQGLEVAGDLLRPGDCRLRLRFGRQRDTAA
jgi:hypothetical protein